MPAWDRRLISCGNELEVTQVPRPVAETAGPRSRLRRRSRRRSISDSPGTTSLLHLHPVDMRFDPAYISVVVSVTRTRP